MKKQISIGKSGNPKCPYEVRWNENGTFKRKRFKLKFDALQFCETLKSELKIHEDFRIEPKDRPAFLRIKSICEQKNMSLEDAVQVLSIYNNPKTAKGCEWEKASELYLHLCQKRNLRNSTQNGYENKLDIFARRMNVQNVADVTIDMAKYYLTNYPSTSHNLKALRPFFTYCIECGWIHTNPFEDIKTPKKLGEKKLASVLLPSEIRNMFDKVPANWLPTFALMTFAGVRPMEILFNPQEPKEVLKISDINFEHKTIRIRPEVAKTRTERVLTHLPANLWMWVQSLKNRDKNENVAVGSYDVCHNIRTKLGVNETDILRHCFGSYGYHYLGAELTIEIMGHVGGFKTFAKHYKGLSNPKSAKEFFAIVP